MADLFLAEQGFPTTPASGNMTLYPDSSNSQFVQRNDAGLFIGEYGSATVAQIASHSADTYYKGNLLPSFSMQAGMIFEWVFPVTKAAGTATPIYTIRIGAAQSVADTARLTLTAGVQTAVADTGVVRVTVTCRNVGAAGVLQGTVWLQHNLAITGFATTPAGFSLTQATSAGFDNTALQGQFVGLSVNPGAAGAWVVEQVISRVWY